MAGIARIGLPIVYERGSGFSSCAGQVVKVLDDEYADLVVHLNGEEALNEGWEQEDVDRLSANPKNVQHVHNTSSEVYPHWRELL